MKRAPRLAFGAALLTLAGCYWLTPYEDLLEGAASVDGGDLPDASADGPPVVVPMVDAGFCASLSPPPTFCDDFDHGTLDAWKVQVTPPSTLTIDIDASSSVRMSIPDDITTTDAVSMNREIGSGSAVTVDFDLRLDSAESNEDVTFLFRLTVGSANLSLWALPGRASVVDVAQQPDAAIAVRASVLDWRPRFGPATPFTHVTFDLTASGDAPTFRLTADGQTTTVPLDPAWKGGTVGLRLGFFRVNAAHGRTAHYDNVVVHLR